MLSSETTGWRVGPPSTPSRAARVFQTGWRGEIAGLRVFNLVPEAKGTANGGYQEPLARGGGAGEPVVTVARRTVEGSLPSERWLLRLSLSLYFLGDAELPAVKENYLVGLAESTSATKSQTPADIQ